MSLTREDAHSSCEMTKLGYRPGLNGLRAIAILLVVSLHALSWPGGGYLGVDLFFVLSGFLITRLLLEEHEQFGRISLHGFFERRIRRLLPALVVMLAVYAVVSAAVGQNPLGPTFEGLFYCTNFFLAFGGQTSPVNHLWSLAQEEQFYLVWPVLLMVLLRFRPRVIVPILAVLLLLLSAHGAYLATHGASGLRLDYSPDTRSDGLIVGCIAGVLWRESKSRIFGIAALVGLPLMVALLLALTPTSPALHVGVLTAIVMYFAVLVHLATQDGRFARALSWRPMSYLGRISYSLYLWHVPILVAIGVATASLGMRLGGVALSVVVAAASYRFVEQPLLNAGRLRSRTQRQTVPSRQPGVLVAIQAATGPPVSSME